MISLDSLLPRQANINCKQCLFISGVLIDPCSKCSIDLFFDEPDIDCESDTETVVPSKKKKTLTEEQLNRKKQNRDNEMKRRSEKIAKLRKKRED